MDLTDSLPEPDRYPFQLRTISIGKVLKEISLLRSDCSTGVDQVPEKYVKQVGNFLLGPLAHIINVYVSLIRSFHASGKLQASPPSLIKSTSRQNRTQTIYRSLYFPRSPGLRGFGAEANRPLYWWTIFITPKHLGLQERTVHHNCFARYSGRSYSGHEEGLGHHDGHGRLFEGIWYRKVLSQFLHVMAFSKSFLKWRLNYLCRGKLFL